MAVPTNTDATTATDVGTTLPVTITQQVDDSGTTYTVWYKYTAQSGDVVIGLFPFGDLTTYQPLTHVYTGPDTAPVLYPASSPIIGVNLPIQIPVTAGTTYYIRISSSTGNVSPANLSLLIQRAESLAAPAGSFFINDDTADFPLALLSSVDGSVLQFRSPFPNGESGEVLPVTGQLLIEDQVNNNLVLYGPDLSVITTIDVSSVLLDHAISSDQVDTFYVGASGDTNATVYTFSNTGVVGGTTWTLPSATVVAIAPNLAETKLYVTGQAGTLDSTIKTWNLLTNSFDADFAAAMSGHAAPHDIIVLGDNSVVVAYTKATATKDLTVVRYDAAGSVLNTHSYGSGIDGIANRLTHAIDDPNSFWLWIHTSNGVGLGASSTFKNIKASDFSEIASFSAQSFEDGVSQDVPKVTPTAYFGHSISCPFLVLRVDVVAPGPTGTIIVTKTTPGLSGITTTFPFGASGGLSPSSFSLTSGTSQTFTATVGSGYGIAETPPTGWTVTYTVSNGSDVNNLTVAEGETVTVTAANTVTHTSRTDPVRRLRQTAHLSDEQVWLFFSKFQLDCETGVGLNNGQGSDPQVMLSWSSDGGHTWSPEQWMSAGKQGEYTRRVIWRRLGRSRDRVWRIVVSDPVAWRLLTAYIDVAKGTS